MPTAASAPTRRLIDVALPLPLFRTFTYELGEGHEHHAVAGSRVVVPFRGRREIGICLGEADGTELKVIPKAVLSVPDAEPALDVHLLELAGWLADYYVVPIGVAMRAMLPGVLTGAARPSPPVKTRRVVSVSRELPSLAERDRTFARAPKQRELYEMVESRGGRAAIEHLLEQLRFSPSVLKGLVAQGLVTVADEVIARDPFATRARLAAGTPIPTPEQQQAIDAASAAASGDVFLLHGITGSGKTLVYIELLRRVVLEQKRSAIVLVPEIALTPQTVDRFRSVFGDQVAVLHSALGDGERYDAWLALKRGERRIAVGARSAIFAPLENLGAIVLDEEHEASYKQGESPRYHARELAVMRGKQSGAVVVLGSATPSLESWVNASSGKYRLLSLHDRVGGGRLPAVDVVDLRRRPAPSEANQPPHRQVLSEELESALGDCLQRGEQSILLLNRRGYASFIQCGACGYVATCPNCSITLTYHRTPERLVCHYCLHQEAPSARCERCKGPTLRQRGLGTQQVERLLVDRFPTARVTRMDVDTTGAKWAHSEILDRVGRGEVDILLGTQMIAKGLDFANVTLVGVIDADVGINLPDFRASERCFQLLSQVAGRAGRGPKGGRVLIQTRLPTHHAVRCALTHDYLGFVNEELPARADPPYPPTIRLANVVFSGTVEQGVSDLAERAAIWLTDLIARRAPGQVVLVGPAPCPVERIKTRYRWHLLLKSAHAGALTRVARYFLERFDIPASGQMRVMVDRDPVSLL